MATPKASLAAEQGLVGINVLLPTQLHRRFRSRAVLDGQTLSEAVALALTAYLES